jgi:hypothetical protein
MRMRRAALFLSLACPGNIDTIGADRAASHDFLPGVSRRLPACALNDGGNSCIMRMGLGGAQINVRSTCKRLSAKAVAVALALCVSPWRVRFVKIAAATA